MLLSNPGTSDGTIRVCHAAQLKQTFINPKSEFYCYHTHCCLWAANATQNLCFLVKYHQHIMRHERTAIQIRAHALYVPQTAHKRTMTVHLTGCLIGCQLYSLLDAF